MVVVTKDENIGCKINGYIKQALIEQAQKEGITLSKFIEQTLIKELKRREVTITANFITKII